MNCESWLDPKNSFITALTGLGLMRSCGMSVSSSPRLILSFTALSILNRPILYWFSRSSPTERTRRFPRWSMSSTEPCPFLSSIR